MLFSFLPPLLSTPPHHHHTRTHPPSQYTSVADTTNDVTPEEMEAYRLKKSRGADDPMAAFKGSKASDGYDLL